MRPSSNSRTNVSSTAAERPASIVKRSRDQSADSAEPSHLLRDRAARLVLPGPDALGERFASERRAASLPSALSCCSTTICVAIPAWSVPTCQSVLSPLIRCQRISTSISVCWNACPMCSVPVTFGGGSCDANGGAPARHRRLEVAARFPQRVPLRARWRAARSSWRVPWGGAPRARADRTGKTRKYSEATPLGRGRTPDLPAGINETGCDARSARG